MAEPEDMTIRLLRELRERMDQRFDSVESRLDKLEAAQKNFPHALTADSMMSKFITGDFEERIIAIERKVGIETKAD
ncbi:MAG: hypothetical protein AAGG69_15935 [Pseudomonadota bacterium]